MKYVPNNVIIPLALAAGLAAATFIGCYSTQVKKQEQPEPEPEPTLLICRNNKTGEEYFARRKNTIWMLKEVARNKLDGDLDLACRAADLNEDHIVDGDEAMDLQCRIDPQRKTYFGK